MRGRTNGRVRSLDLLRAVAIIAVVFYHFPRVENQMVFRALTHFGWTGVDLFFVLSGYLIGSQLFSSLKTNGTVDLRKFYMRRILRTLPSYYLVLLIHVLWLGVSEDWEHTRWKYWFFLQNFDVLRQFGQSWSLCVEEHFYFFFPILVLLFRRARVMHLWLGLGAVYFLGCAVRFFIWKAGRPDLVYSVNTDRAWEIYLGRVFYPTYTHFEGIAAGVALAGIKIFHKEKWEWLQKNSNQCLGIGIVLLLAAAILVRHQMNLFATVFGFPSLAVAFSAIVLAGAEDRSILQKLSLPWVEALGIASYSIYLTHVLALAAANYLCLQWKWNPTGLSAGMVSCFSVLLFGAALYLGVEKPFLTIFKKNRAT